jgi:hypothetical protein
MIRGFFRNDVVIVVGLAILTQTCVLGRYLYGCVVGKPLSDFWGAMAFLPFPAAIGLLIFGGIYHLLLFVAERKMAKAFDTPISVIQLAVKWENHQLVENLLTASAELVWEQLSRIEGRASSLRVPFDVMSKRKREIKTSFWGPYKYAYRLGFHLKYGMSNYLSK